MARGVAGGAFSTVRAQEAITLDACRPPLLLSLRGTSCRVAKYRIPPALSPPCRCLGGEESRPPPALRLSRRKLKPSLRSPGLKAVIMRGIGLNIFSSLFFSARGERRGRENFFFSCVSRLYFRRGIYDFFDSEKESLEKVALYNVLEGG